MERKIGIQLWSVRQDLEKDFKGGLRRLAEMGYQGVEFAGYYGIPAGEMKALLKELGLEVCGVHHGVDELDEKLDEIIAYNKVLGNKDIVCAYAPTANPEEIGASIKKMQRIARVLDAEGMKFHYHNHSHEFKVYDGEYALDQMAKAVPGMMGEIDTYWVWHAGVDVLDYLESRRGDVELVHIKDGTREVMTAVGEGDMDIQAVLDKCADLGARWLIVEDESTPGGMDSVALGIRNLKEKYIIR